MGRVWSPAKAGAFVGEGAPELVASITHQVFRRFLVVPGG